MSAMEISLCGNDELVLRLEAAHYQCMQKSLLHSGMGEWTSSDERMLQKALRQTTTDTGEPLLFAVLDRIKDARLQARYVEMFAHENVDVNTRDESDRTPLMICLERGLDKSARHLIQSEILDHYLCDNRGNTALHYAAKFGRTAVLRPYLKVFREQLQRQLRESGARYLVHQDIFNVRNKMGETMLDSAIHADNEETAHLITKEKTIQSILVSKKLGTSRPLKRNVSFESVHRCADEPESDGSGGGVFSPNPNSGGKDSPMSLRKLWRRWRSPPPSPRPRVVSAVSRTEFFKNKIKTISNRPPSSEQSNTPSTPDPENQWFPALAMRRRSVSESGIRPTIRGNTTDIARTNKILRDPNGLLKRNNCLPPLMIPTK